MNDGKPTIIPSAEGLAAHRKMFPSIVAFMESGQTPVVGGAAEKYVSTNPDRVVTAIKRKMGTDYRVKIGGKWYTPQEITAMILRKIMQDAEAFLGERIRKAVITVPAYFNDNQRTATRDAALIAGLDAVRVINEPTAASLAYGLDKTGEDLNIAVLDLGGGTFDVTIMEMCGAVFRVLSTSGDTQLGGIDMDEKIVEYFLQEIERKHGVNLEGDSKALGELRIAAEQAKIFLSDFLSVPIGLSLQSKGRDLKINTVLTRAKLEELIKEIIDRIDKPMEQALMDSGLGTEDIDKVILVGGPTKMPIVQKKFKEFFGKNFEQGIDPMHCVAVGAAIQGSILAGEITDLVILDVTPLSLGIETSGGVFAPLIKRNTTIPTEAVRTFTTADDFQTVMPIRVLQGERPMATDNISLGLFYFTGIKPALRHEPLVEVTFSIDANGILTVTAEELETGRKLKDIIHGTTKLPKEETERMVKEAVIFADIDEKKKEEIEVQNRGEVLIYEVEKMLKEERIFLDEKIDIEKAVEELKKTLEEGNTKKIEKQLDELTKLVDETAMRSRMRKRACAFISLAKRMMEEISAEERVEIEKMVVSLKWALQNGNVEEIKKGIEELTEAIALLDVGESG